MLPLELILYKFKIELFLQQFQYLTQNTINILNEIHKEKQNKLLLRLISAGIIEEVANEKDITFKI